MGTMTRGWVAHAENAAHPDVAVSASAGATRKSVTLAPEPR